MRFHLATSITLAGLLVAGCGSKTWVAEPAPGEQAESAGASVNIVWIISDDHGPELGAYGTPHLITPTLDALASQGYLFTNAHSTSPICSPSRSAFMTGMYQTSINAHHHRSNRGAPLPGGVRPVTHLFRDAGYFTSNTDGIGGPGKVDLNFDASELVDGIHWRERSPGQPFFAIVNIFPPHRPFVEALDSPTNPDLMVLPPWYPDRDDLRRDLAQYHDSIRLLDARAEIILDQLAEDGLLDSTHIFFFGDNGRPFARDKQFLYTGGTHVPLIIRPAGGLNSTVVRDDLVSLIDVTAESLRLAGIPLPDGMHGQPFLAGDSPPRTHLFAARDRGDETVDRIRSVRTARFNHIRNFMPERPWIQGNIYKEWFYPDWRVFRDEFHAFPDDPRIPFLGRDRPFEELYDLESDPHELINLADDPAFADILAEMRDALDQWMIETGDMGRIPEDPRHAREAYLELIDAYRDIPKWVPERPTLWQDGPNQ